MFRGNTRNNLLNEQKNLQEGFSLVELMVVVSIIGILVAIAIPIYRNNTAASERAVVEANLRILDSAIMHYVVAEGVYPVDNNESGDMVWIIQNPSWNKGNKLEPFVSPFSSIKGERYLIYGTASAPVPISTNRAFIVLSSGDTIGGHTATRDEYYHLQNLPWRSNDKVSVYEVIADDFRNWDKTVGNKNQLGFRVSGSTHWGYTGTSTDILIPRELDGILLKGIWQYVFENKGLNSALFAEDSKIENIHRDAFAQNNLREISLPSGLIHIDQYAFYNNDLSSIVIPDSVTRIESHAFSRDNNTGKNNITTITIGSNVKTFGNNVFHGNNSFREAYHLYGAGTYKLINGEWEIQ